MSKISEYISIWKTRGYPKDIPDEVPDVLMELQLAPSYKAIAFAILKNDLQCTSLGFTAMKSEWYGILKRIEIEARGESCNEKALRNTIDRPAEQTSLIGLGE